MIEVQPVASEWFSWSIITGDTFAARATLRAHHCEWLPKSRTWQTVDHGSLVRSLRAAGHEVSVRPVVRWVG